MPLIQQNPWQDAANFGSGFASTLGQILLGIPKEKYDVMRQQQMMPLQQQLIEAQIANLKSRPEIQQQMMDLRQQGLENQEQRTKDLGEFQRGENDIRQQNLDMRGQLQSLQEQLKGRPTTDQSSTQGQKAVTDFADRLANQQGIDTSSKTATPISVSPDVVNSAIDAAMRSGQTNGSPYEGALNALVKLAPILAPFLKTNMAPQVQTNGWFRGNTTNMVPNVTTNAFQLSAPQQQPTSPPLTATNPRTGQKIQSFDGGNTWQ